MICLIVDDSVVIRAIASAVAERQGFTVLEAADGVEAIRLCAEVIPDVILLDCHRPRTDGPTFLRRLRRSPAGDRPRVVFCTTDAHREAADRALEAGANAVVIKPFDAATLIAKFKQVEARPVTHAA